MANLVIVAIPAAEDDVWKVSSEKVPHMTLLFLGDAMSNPNVTKISDYVKQKADKLAPFNLRVDHRGVLGTDEADVLFFAQDIPWSVQDFRDRLKNDVNIRSAYSSIPQHTDWSPHLTLGYPGTPANADTWDPALPLYVKFDKVAVWFGDYEGVEVPLFDNSNNNFMSDSPELAWSHKVEDILAHHGVRGQKWGVRRARGASAVSVTQKGKKLKSTGGEGRKPSSDALAAKKIGQVKKKSGVHALTNEELQAYQKRLNLEQNITSLERNQPGAGNYVKRLLKTSGNQQVNTAANTAASKAVSSSIKKAATVAVAV